MREVHDCPQVVTVSSAYRCSRVPASQGQAACPGTHCSRWACWSASSSRYAAHLSPSSAHNTKDTDFHRVLEGINTQTRHKSDLTISKWGTERQRFKGPVCKVWFDFSFLYWSYHAVNTYIKKNAIKLISFFTLTTTPIYTVFHYSELVTCAMTIMSNLI